jgi:hypothetical protein
VLPAPLVDAAATSQKLLSKFLITTKTQTIIASHQKLDFHSILSLSDFTMEQKTCPMLATLKIKLSEKKT